MFKCEPNIIIGLMEKNRIDFGEVLLDVFFFRDKHYPCEFEKHKNNIKHLNKFIKKYKKYNWYKGNVSISTLSNVYVASVGWIRKLACQYKNCSKYTNTDDCISCENKKMQEIYLQDIVNGFVTNKSIFAKKIDSIKDKIESNNLDFLFCTIIKDNKKQYRIYDGNSRLIAYALSNPNGIISCYIGEKT